MAGREEYITIQFDPNNPDIEAIFAQMPEQFAKAPIQSTLRTAVKPFITEIGRNLPPNFEGYERTIAIKNNRSASILAGIQNKRMYVMLGEGDKQKRWDAFYPLYWMNYGTLENRHPLHRFDKPRRDVSKKWKGGIKPLMFMQLSWDNTSEVIEQLIKKNLSARVVKFLQKKAKKASYQ